MPRREREREVRIRLHISRLIAGSGPVRAAPLHLDRVAGRVDGLERAFALQVHLYADIPDRLRGELLRVEGQHVADEAVLRLEQFRIGKGDALIAVRSEEHTSELQ